MNEVNNLYPIINDNGQVFRLNTCYTILEKIKKNLQTYEMIRVGKNKKHSRLKCINGVSTLCGTICSVSGGIISSTGLGLIFGGPLIGVSSLFCISSLISLKYDKKLC